VPRGPGAEARGGAEARTALISAFPRSGRFAEQRLVARPGRRSRSAQPAGRRLVVQVHRERLAREKPHHTARSEAAAVTRRAVAALRGGRGWHDRLLHPLHRDVVDSLVGFQCERTHCLSRMKGCPRSDWVVAPYRGFPSLASSKSRARARVGALIPPS
jgi:hypothetical protein